MSRYLVKQYFWKCPRGCFRTRLAPESIERVKCTALPDVDRDHLTCWGPAWKRRQKKGGFALHLTAALGWQPPYCSGCRLGLDIYAGRSLARGPSDYIMRLPGSPVCRELIVGLLSLHTHVCQHLITCF